MLMSSSVQPKRSVFKTLVKALGAILITCLLLIALMPAALSTNWGKDQLVRLINGQISGKADIAELQLTWFGPQQIHGAILKDPQGTAVISLQKFTSDSTLPRLIWNPLTAGAYDMEGLNGELVTDATGTTNLQRALNNDCCAPPIATGNPQPTIQIKDVKARFNASTLHIIGSTQQETLNGKFVIDAELEGMTPEQLIKYQGDWSTLHAAYPEAALRVDVDVANFPIALADQFIALKQPEFAGVLVQSIGPQLNLTIKQKMTSQGIALTMKAWAQHLTASAEALISDSITLAAPLEATCVLSPQAYQSLISAMHMSNSLSLVSPVNIHLVVNNFSMPSLNVFKGKSDFASLYQQAGFRAELAFTPIIVSGIPSIESATLADLSVVVTAAPDSPSSLSINANVSQPANAGLINALLGTQLGVSLTTQVSVDPNGTPKFGAFNMQAKSDLASMQFSGEVIEGTKFKMSAPALIDYTFTTAGLQSMGIASDHYAINHSKPLKLSVSSTHIPLTIKEFKRIFLTGDIKISDLVLSKKSDVNAPIAALDDLTARWTVDGTSGLITVDFAGATRLEREASGKLSGGIAIGNWQAEDGMPDFKQASLRINAAVQKLPTEMVAALAGHDELTLLLGDAIDLTLKGQCMLSTLPQGNFSFHIQSPHLNGSGAFAIDKELYLHNDAQSAEFNLELTPQGYVALRRGLDPRFANEFSLTEASNARVKINSLSIPLSSIGSSVIHAAIDADVAIDRLAGGDSQRNALALRNLHGKLSSPGLSNKIAFEVTAQGNSFGRDSSWRVLGSVQNALRNDGSINHQGLSLSLDGAVENMPIALLCNVICKPTLGRQIEAAIGPTLNAKVNAQLQRMNGPIYLDARGNNGFISVDAQMYEGVLTLRNNLEAQVAITPQFGQYVLQEFIPIVNGILGSDQPMKLTIDKEGFALPLQEINLNAIAIQSATLEMGKVRFSGKSQLAKILSLLTPANADQIQVWLTPAYFSLNNGALTLRRLDLLINESYPMAAWGNVDMRNDRVSMMVGLSGTAIAKAFGVSGIPKGYMLQLPFRGTLADASIDKTKAAARLSALVAQTQGGPHGLVLGTVLDIATGGMSEPKVPSPTTTPLPWNHLMEQTEDSSSSEKQTTERKAVAPIEEIGKSAGNLLKKLFK